MRLVFLPSFTPLRFAFSKPELDIKNDDTICSHGATTGPLDQEQVFYLRSRGIPEPEAIEMLIDAFYQDIKNRMEVA